MELYWRLSFPNPTPIEFLLVVLISVETIFLFVLFVDNPSAHQSRKWQIILSIGTALRRTRCQIQFKTKRTLSSPSKIVIMFQIFADNSDLV